MSNHAQGWRRVNGIEMMPVEESSGIIRAVILFVVALVVLYVWQSFDCATGGSCTFANASAANWIATHRWLIGIISAASVIGIALGISVKSMT